MFSSESEVVGLHLLTKTKSSCVGVLATSTVTNIAVALHPYCWMLSKGQSITGKYLFTPATFHLHSWK